MYFVDKDLLSMQESRVLLEKMYHAQSNLNHYSSVSLDKIARSLISVFKKHYRQFIELEYQETRCGNVDDACQLLLDVLNHIDEHVQEKILGILKEDEQGQELEVGVPVGGIVSLLPMTNATLYLFYILLLSIKSGNALILVPHQATVKAIKDILDIVKPHLEDQGLLFDALLYFEHVVDRGVGELLANMHEGVVLNIGRSTYDTLMTQCVRPVYYAAIEPSPAFIEKSADIQKAVKDVINSRTFNNGILPASEQYLIVEKPVAKEVKQALENNGAYYMTKEEEHLLLNYMTPSEFYDSTECIGKSAEYLAKRAGFNVPNGTTLLVSMQDYISDLQLYTNNIYGPVLIVYEEPDWICSCEKCIQLLQESQRGHTLAIHSHNKHVIHEFIMKKPVGRIIVNGPATFSSMGLHSDLSVTVLFGGRTTGRGSIATNIVPKDFTYTRHVGYGKERIVKDNKAVISDDILLFIRTLSNELHK
ncbi:hypothetical protein KG091_08310 [Carnobacteriaceae bacterium zg-ZUI78]|nr:hypothetical protein [Carnobacteriaceae bacterium zg-ZUI78]